MTDAKELSKAYDPTDVEARWYPYWLERNYFRAEVPSDKPPFSIVLPPPNVTGSLHLGHALTATIQDILIRWKRMSGYNCLWLPGTDHAGIATQTVVERELKKTEGKSRHDLGRAAFVERVWAWKEKFGKRIGDQHKFLGASLDWSRERFTMDERSSAAVKEVFVRLYEEGLIYRAQKLINWCPSCRTALSDLEVEHEEKNGSLWHIQYPVKDSDRKLTVATTRPETMLGDTAVAVHPEDPRYAGLVGQSVVLPLTNREIPIIADPELVNMEFGTGVVKVTPAHDFNDYQTGLRHGLPMLSILDDAARINQEGGPYAGMERYEARTKVLEDLTALGLLEKEEPHKLSVGGCQRCGTTVEPRLSPQWFVKIEPLAKPAIEAVEQGRTKFVPEAWKNTYFHWMNNIHDWTISRQLWWGHQIPAWYCTQHSPKNDDGSIDVKRAEPLVTRGKPESCPECGGHEFIQDEDVLDTWFSSGLWPFSTLGWPEQTEELKAFYPTSVMETGHDIIFFWVARMMMMGLHFMKDVPFHTVYLHAMVRDEKGEKMSKTKGNVIDPLDIVHGAPADRLPPSLRNKFPQGMPAFGADALRFTLASLTQQGRDIKLSMDRVGGYKAFSNKLWNASRFALMNMGDFQLGEDALEGRELSLADRWILSRLNRAVEDTRKALEAYAFSEAASTLYQFLWAEFCDWYIELAKGSLYGEDAKAKDTTRAVLVFALDRILRLLHPFMPFITEEIWQKLPMARSVDSIMIASYPEPDARLEDAAAEAEMTPIIRAIEGVRTIRGESNLPPSAKLSAQIQSSDAATRATLEKWRNYLMPLAGLADVQVGEPGPKPRMAAADVSAQMEIYVPLAGLVDFGAERERIRKEIAKGEQELTSLRKKLDNPNFVARAPAEVVEKDRARVQELEARKVKLQDHLERIAEEPATPEAPAALEAPPAPPAKAEPAEAAPIESPESATVKVASSQEQEGDVNLGQEMQADLEASHTPAEAMDPHVQQALAQLREGTKEGLSPTDHHDLGVAYMSMGLVDDAMREFDEARKGGDTRAVPAKGGGKKAAVKKKGAAKKAPAKKAAAKKSAAKKAPAKKAPAKKSATKKAAVKKGAAKKAAAKKAPAKKVAVKKGAAKKAPAKKTVAKKGAAKKAPAKKAVVKKGAAKKATSKKVPARKAPAKKATAKKTPVRKGAAKKAATRKAPARKTVAKKSPAKKKAAAKRRR